MERRVYWLLSGFKLRVEYEKFNKAAEILPLDMVGVLPSSLFALLAEKFNGSNSCGRRPHQEQNFVCSAPTQRERILKSALFSNAEVL